MKNWKPIFIENSKIPVWLSHIAPLNIGAICLGVVVFSRGAMNKRTRRHETIHFQQVLETLLIGTAIIYAYDYLKGLWKYRNDWKDQYSQRGLPYTSAGNKAYHRVRSEQEAYDNEWDLNYLATRPRLQGLTKYKV